MRLVQFALQRSGQVIVYPDAISQFRNAQIEAGMVIAEYTGDLALDDYVPGQGGLERILSKLAFRRLFTFEERLAFDNFETSSTLTDEQKQYLRTLTKDFELADEIDMADPDTASGLAYLESCGILDAGRAAQILAVYGL